jgi:hypothetical protein
LYEKLVPVACRIVDALEGENVAFNDEFVNSRDGLSAVKVNDMDQVVADVIVSVEIEIASGEKKSIRPVFIDCQGRRLHELTVLPHAD